MATMQQPAIRNWDFPRGVASAALMVGYAREHGVTTARMLRGTGLTERALADPDAQIDAHTELAVIRNLVRALADERPALGVEVGRRYRITTFGIFGFACVSSPTLGEAISFAMRYLELSFTFCIPVTRSEPGEFVAWIHDEQVPADVRRFLLERDVLAMHQVMSDLLGRPLELVRAEFDYPEPEYVDTLAEIIGVRPVFGQSQNVLALDPAVLAQPLPQANEHTWAMCLAQCRDLVHRRRARTGIAAEVRERLVPHGGADGFAAPPGIDAVARDLNMSTRTLRRHLDAAGTSYRALLDEVRRALAEEMLSATPLSVSDVAIRLGYAEASTFIYAFKRWTGTTPSAYRRERASV
ncbi:AraC family transcriptional regulator [Nocardia sp. CDC159]|uniref:AraC family transcriptional regulator n=1 Tax=Nocardia pulmonis TaxID=2951408 RepID=A0A9X2E3P7_9NOCA|nr:MULTISPECIES: AraC family transcriptional regulator [Nocardia]MCM6773076.1 AraC family transcriptional regulator [Nocardia pulmonis]MCM6785621.1 AraC family transcriptional regulator [Nocardia sp. CDC159]